MPNRIGHFEIHATNPEALIPFYTEVFGWTISKWDSDTMEYWMVMTGERDEAGGINGGLVRRVGGAPAAGQSPNAFVCTMVVDDFDAIAEKIIAHGGVLALEKANIAGMAWQGYFTDPDGNLFGIHQPITQ